MKKNYFLAIAALIILLAGCKKDRTCECTNTFTSGSTGSTYFLGNPPQTTTTTYKKVKKSDMKKLCRDSKYTSVSSNSGGSYTYMSESKCKIK